MSIPIASPSVGQAAIEHVVEVLESGYLADGPEVRAFEEQFAAFCGTEHSVATSNGTTAIHAALVALGIGEGDQVLTTPFSFIATANAIRLAGAEPVFADIDPQTFNLDPVAAAEAAEDAGGVEAIMPVHLYGLPSEVKELQAVADEHDAYLIEDAAQAHGAEYRGDRVGSLGDVACFSFYPTKNMTTGEGGMIVIDEAEIADRASQFINHGRDGSGVYGHGTVGHNFRMTSMAGALGQAQLDRLPTFTQRRRENAARLNEGLAEANVETPVEPDGMQHVYHQYTIRTTDRESLQQRLDTHDIGYGVYYPTCIHEQPAYDALEHTAPVAEQAAEEVLSLPVHPGVSEADIERMIEVITNE